MESSHDLEYNQWDIIGWCMLVSMIAKPDGRCEAVLEKKLKQNRVFNRNRSVGNGFARLGAGVTALCIVFTLLVPVFAVETVNADLTGKVLHTHDAFCRDSDGRIICPLPELEEHTHTEQCYEAAAQGHVHTDACYTMERGALTCQISDRGGHVHADDCYQTVTQETEATHEHTAACYTKQKGEQTCTIPEQQGHSHTSACYASGALTCGTEESEDHTHSDSCYEKVLTCETPEETGHAHGDACFAWTEVLSCDVKENSAAPKKILVCTETEEIAHVHTDACYEWTKTLSCGEEEHATDSALPEEAEKLLICSKPELKQHTHTEGCYDSGRLGKGKLVCGYYQMEQHQHTDSCLSFTDAELICEEKENQDHKHSRLCYRSWSFLCQTEKETKKGPQSDPTADVETAEIWEKTFEHVKLTGAWSYDLLAIAQTQLGYEESDRNFVIEKGVMRGYTRYGEWYGGVEYGDWCAMFIAFCMHYAGVEGVPVSCSCAIWTDHLKAAEMYAAADAHTPRPGDLIFFDSSRTAQTPETVPMAPDHVAIVAEVIPATQEEPAAVVTIEGNYYNCVRYETRYMDDPRIIGYGLLPDGPAALYSCGLKDHTHETGCYNEAEMLVCQVKEHTHTESCRSRKLRYADESVSVDITLSDAVYLPANLCLRAGLVTQNEESVYDAMTAAVAGAMPAGVQTSEDAVFCRMQLLSGGKPYELPAGVRADVHVTFAQPMFAAKTAMDDAERYAFLLIEEVSEEAADAAPYRAVELTTDSYTNTDDGIMGVSFRANRISAFSVTVAYHTAAKDSLLQDLVSRIMQ